VSALIAPLNGITGARMKLYYNPYSPNARRAWATMLHLDLGGKIDLVAVDLPKGENMKAEFLALNPNHKVPVLVDGDFKLWESAAVAMYLAENTPNQKVWPMTSRGRADAMRWMSWHMCHFGPAVGVFNWENCFKTMMKQTPDQALLEKATKDFHTFAPVLNTHLENRKWLLGDEMTLADFYVGAGLGFEPYSKLPLEQYANIRKWNERLLTVPAWAATAPKLG
jgi:glutathione S-transferase